MTDFNLAVAEHALKEVADKWELENRWRRERQTAIINRLRREREVYPEVCFKKGKDDAFTEAETFDFKTFLEIEKVCQSNFEIKNYDDFEKCFGEQEYFPYFLHHKLEENFTPRYITMGQAIKISKQKTEYLKLCEERYVCGFTQGLIQYWNEIKALLES